MKRRTLTNPIKIRSTRGSAITEFGASLWVLLLCFFLPLIQIVSLLVSYACCYVLNNMQVEQAAVLPASQTGTIVNTQLPQQWQKGGLGIFANCSGTPKTQVSYSTTASPAGQVKGPAGNVTVTTTFTILPMIQVPYLSGPLVFSISTQREIEDPNGNND